MLKIIENQLEIPEELYSFLRKPRMVFLFGTNLERLWIMRFNMKYLVKIIMRVIRRDVLLLARYEHNDESIGTYKIIYSQKIDPSLRNYRIVNYETRLLLVQSKNDNDTIDRENFWKSISGYNEHLDLSKQIKTVDRRTKWLADEIQNYNPESVLEVGCGSGRNLYYIQKIMPDCKLFGVEINQEAIDKAKNHLGGEFQILTNSIYNLDEIQSDSIDLVFTSGVLMHIPKKDIDLIIKNLIRIARKVVMNLELHGPAHVFDFHRYPRDYSELYTHLENVKYEIFDRKDFRNAGSESFYTSFLVLEK